MATRCAKCDLPMDVVSTHRSKNIVWTCNECLRTVSKPREEFNNREIITL